MTRAASRSALLGVCAAGVVSLAWSAFAQAELPAPMVYRREVFQYPRAARPDPFRSLLSAEDLGYRIEDLQLTGVIYSPNQRLSVAVLTEAVSKKRFRLHVGERIGGITVAAIYPRRVDVVVNEFGVIRRETLQLRRPEPVRQGEQQSQPAQQTQQQQGPPSPPSAGTQGPAAQQGSGQ